MFKQNNQRKLTDDPGRKERLAVGGQKRGQLKIMENPSKPKKTVGRHPTTKVLLPCWESERAKWGCFAWNCEEIAGDGH